jgi:hypothetical protein
MRNLKSKPSRSGTKSKTNQAIKPLPAMSAFGGISTLDKDALPAQSAYLPLGDYLEKLDVPEPMSDEDLWALIKKGSADQKTMPIMAKYFQRDMIAMVYELQSDTLPLTRLYGLATVGLVQASMFAKDLEEFRAFFLDFGRKTINMYIDARRNEGLST